MINENVKCARSTLFNTHGMYQSRERRKILAENQNRSVFLSEVDSQQYDGFQYRGGDGILQMRLAWAQSKEGQIELIEVKSTEPNVYHDLVAQTKLPFITLGSGQMITMQTRVFYLQVMRSQWTWEKIRTFVTLIQQRYRAI